MLLIDNRLTNWNNKAIARHECIVKPPSHGNHDHDIRKDHHVLAKVPWMEIIVLQ